MGLTLSALRLRFYLHRLIARNLTIPSNEITSLREKFCELPGSMLYKLKRLHSEVFTKVHWGRLLVFFNFVEPLGLTDEEWEQVFDFLVPTLTQMQEQIYDKAARRKVSQVLIFTLSGITAHFQPYSLHIGLLRGSSDCSKLLTQGNLQVLVV